MAWVRRAVEHRDAASRMLVGYGVPSARRTNACRSCVYFPQILCEWICAFPGPMGARLARLTFPSVTS